MKKKIILFLSVLVIAMFLTGCSTKTYSKALESSNEVANEIASNMGEYKLPDGYDMSYPDSKDTGRFYLESKTEQDNTLKAEYQISNKEATLVAFTVDDNKSGVYFFVFLMIFILGMYIGLWLERSN